MEYRTGIPLLLPVISQWGKDRAGPRGIIPSHWFWAGIRACPEAEGLEAVLEPHQETPVSLSPEPGHVRVLCIGRDRAMLQGLAGAGRAAKAEVTPNRAEQPDQTLPCGWTGNICAVGQRRGTEQVLPNSCVCSTVLSLCHLCHLCQWPRAIPALPSREKRRFSPWADPAGFTRAAEAQLVPEVRCC